MPAAPPTLTVRRNRFGRGLYALSAVERGAIVELSPVIVLPKQEIGDRDTLGRYVFEWSRGRYALALGVGSIFNHSALEPNVGWRLERARQRIAFRALRPIARGEELLLDYGYDPCAWL